MLEADLHIPTETMAAMGLETLGDCFQEATVRDVTMISCDDASAVATFTLSKSIDDVLDDSEAVEWWERLDSPGSDSTYLCKVRASQPREVTELYREGELALGTVTAGNRGVTLTLVGSQEALQHDFESYEAVDAPVSLERLTDYEGPRDDRDLLTTRQQEVLETAYELGYYEVPRETTADAIARRLDLDRSTVTEHLQRAERNLVASVVSD